MNHNVTTGKRSDGIIVSSCECGWLVEIDPMNDKKTIRDAGSEDSIYHVITLVGKTAYEANDFDRPLPGAFGDWKPT